MRYKIFEFNVDGSNAVRIMAMETKEFVEYYMQINSSNWHFCHGSKDDFDALTIDDAMTVYDFYNSQVKEDEAVLEEHANKSLNLK